jgi:hypothetical protein
MLRNSIWACIAGGSDVDIGNALLLKTIGAAYNGAQTVSIIEPLSLQTYTVQYDRPVIVDMLVKLTLSQGTSSANLPITGLQAVIDFANGVVDSELGFVVGANVSPFDISVAIADENPGVKIRKVEVAPLSTGVYQTTEYPIAYNQQAHISTSEVTVIIV